MTRDDLELVATSMERAAKAAHRHLNDVAVLLPVDELPAGVRATVTGLVVYPHRRGPEYVAVFLSDLRGWLAATEEAA